MGKKRVELDLTLSHFKMPPVQSAIVIGKRAPFGSKAVFKSLNDLAPHTFTKIDINDDIIESVIIKKSILRKVPEDKIIPLIVDECKKIMNEEDSIHIKIDLVLNIKKIISNGQ